MSVASGSGSAPLAASPAARGAPARSAIPVSARDIAFLTVPQFGLMLCHMGMSMTDVTVTGLISPAAQASLGVVGQVFTLLMLVASLAGSGCLAAVSQALGMGLEQRAARYAAFIVLLALTAGGIIAVASLAGLPLILRVMNVTEEMRPVVRCFVTAYCCQLPFYYALIMMNSVFRAYRLVILPFFAMLAVALVNLAGSTLFGLGLLGFPDFGYAGVAWASFASSLLGFVWNLRAAVRRGILRRAFLPSVRWARGAAPYLLRVGGPSALGNIAGQSGNLVIYSLLSGLPGDGVSLLAGLALGMTAESLLLFPVAALGMSMAILGGHLLGEGRSARLRELGGRTALVAFCLATGCAVLLFVLREQVGTLLAPREETAAALAFFLGYSCLSLPARCAGMILHGVFSGTGATRLSCMVNCMCMWVLYVPLAFLLARGLSWGAAGVFSAMAASHYVSFIWTIRLFRGKKWLEYGMRRRQNG